MIKEVALNDWLVYRNYSATQNLIDIQAEREKSDSKIGKYLFFSDEKKLLIDLAKKILEKYDLFTAKVPITNTPKAGDKGFGFVLCVYDTSPKLKDELKQYGDEGMTIHYRYWKSDKATLEGKYSKEYLATKESRR